MKKLNIDTKRFIVCLISILSIVYIFAIVFVLNHNYIDNLIIIRKDTLIEFFRIVTKLGNWYTLIAITIFSLILKNKKYFKYISINLIIVTIMNQILKIIFQRPRPDLDIMDASGYSFPSGHAMVSMAFYGLLLYLILKSNIQKKIKILLSILLSLIIILIGISRIYLGVHYVTDVLAGYFISIVFLAVYTSFIKKKENNL